MHLEFDIALAFVQSLAMTACLLMPGRLVLRSLLGNSWTSLPPARKVGLAIVVSSLLLALLEALVLVLEPSTVQLANRSLAILCSLDALRRLRRPLMRPVRSSAQAVLILGLAAWFLASLGVQWRTYIPGSVPAGYGDVPSYARAVENLRRGQFPMVDFRIGDYDGEVYFLPTHYPLITTVAAFFKSLFPGNAHAFTSLCTLYGLLALYCAAISLGSGLNLARSALGTVLLVLALLPLMYALNAFDFALGSASLPAFAFIFWLADLTFDAGGLTTRSRTVLWFAAAIAALMSRPEGFLFVGLLSAFLVVRWAWQRFTRLGRGQRVACAMLVLLAVPLALQAPWTRMLGKSPGLFYLHYSERQQTFVFSDRPGVMWNDVNFDNSRESVGLERRKTSMNQHLVDEVRAHPFAFIGWMFDTFKGSLTSADRFVLAMSLLLIALVGRGPVRLLAPITVAYVVVLVAMNPAFSSRHTLPVFTLLIISGLAVLRQSWPRLWRLLLSNRTALVLLVLTAAASAFGLHDAREARLAAERSGYTEVFRRIDDHTDPDSMIACQYPQLAAYILDRPAVGNSVLVETLEPLVDKYRPDLILIDDLRSDLPPTYPDAKERLTPRWLDEFGYRVLFDEPALHYLILESEEHLRAQRTRQESTGRESEDERATSTARIARPL